MAGTPTIDAIWARRVCEKLQADGISVEEILTRAGIKPNLLVLKGARIAFRQHARLLQLVAETTGNTCFGLEFAARHMDPRDNGLLAYAALSSRTFGEALMVATRYVHVLNEAVEPRVIPWSRGLLLIFHFLESRASDLQQAVEFGIANLVRTSRFLTGTALQPVQVTFLHTRRQDVQRFEEFFGCSVRFGERRNSVTFSQDNLALPLGTTDERLHGILIDYCNEVLARRANCSPDLRQMVEKSITTLLPQGEVRLQRVAPALGMSVRTLGRRLAASGITFAQILDGLRHDLAVRYLQDPDIPLSQVAFLLGYSEVSGFVHAFRRWTGSTPGAWRANHLA